MFHRATMCSTVIFAASLLVIQNAARAQHHHDHNVHNVQFTLRSLANGRWSEPKTWEPARSPRDGDRILVSRGTTVQYDVVSTRSGVVDREIALSDVNTAAITAFATDAAGSQERTSHRRAATTTLATTTLATTTLAATTLATTALATFALAAPSAGLPTPIAHWKLEDRGRQARDSAGTHHGTIHGGTSHPGRAGQAILFDREKQQHISIPHSPDFEIGTFTVSAWVWLTKEPTFSGILGTRFGGEFNFDMKVNADKVHGDIGDGTRWIDTKINFYKDDVGSNGQGGDLEIRRWYLITFVVDNERKECRLYLDSDRKKTIPFQGEPRLMRAGQMMHIGNTGTNEYMDGVIDEVRIWKHALNDQQVRTLHSEFTGP